MRKIDGVVINCTATNPSWYEYKTAQDVVNEIRRWHVTERKWSDIGYHAVIHRDGHVANGRPVERSGAHTRGANKSTFGKALVGGRGGCADDNFLDHFTEMQQNSIQKLLKKLKQDFPIQWIKGHQDFAKKACPFFFR